MSPAEQTLVPNQPAQQPSLAASDQSKYVLEANPSETERLRMQHDVVKDAMGGKLVLAPVHLAGAGLRILDSATADGYWLEDLRRDYKLGDRDSSCTLIGTDIVPAYFPKPEFLPQGMKFCIQDITEPWPDAVKSSFDLVHQRLGLFATGDQLPKAVSGLIDLVKPGGWIQIVDADLTGPEADGDSPTAPPIRLIKSLLGKNLDDSNAYAANLKHMFQERGLVRVQDQIVEVRFGALNPDPALARKSTTSFVLATEGMVAAAKSMPNPPSANLEELAPNLKKGLDEKGALFRYWVIWGQKPL